MTGGEDDDDGSVVSGASFADSVLTVPPLAVADKRRGRSAAAGWKRLAAVH